MLHLDPNRTFTIRVSLPGVLQDIDEIALGSRVERAVEDAKNRFPEYKRIVVFDSDTKDAVAIIKPNK